VTTFDEQNAASAEPSLALHGEAAIYHPGGGGAARSITVVIERHMDERDAAGGGGGRVKSTTIHALNSATEGISAAEFNRGTDRIEFAERKGVATTITRALGEIASYDGAFLTWEIT